MSCRPQWVTAAVDHALGPAERTALERHLVGCLACQGQAAEETALAERLRRLPPPIPAPLLERRVRDALRLERSRVQRGRLLRWTAALAASLAVVSISGRDGGPALARALADDHAHCHPVRALQLDAKDLGDDAPDFDGREAQVRTLPRAAGGLACAGASLCELRDGSLVVHAQYTGGAQRVSIFMVEPAARPVAVPYQTCFGALAVRLQGAGGALLGLVTDGPEDLERFGRAFASARAPERSSARLLLRREPPGLVAANAPPGCDMGLRWRWL